MPDLAQIREHFPDYPLGSVPGDIPNWLTPNPWRDDAMPIWSTAEYVESGGETGLSLSIDYPDPGMRENAGWKRFIVFTLKDGETVGVNFVTEDWPEALAELRRRWMS